MHFYTLSSIQWNASCCHAQIVAVILVQLVRNAPVGSTGA